MFHCKKCSIYMYDWEFDGKCQKCRAGPEFVEHGSMQRGPDNTDFFWEADEELPVFIHTMLTDRLGCATAWLNNGEWATVSKADVRRIGEYVKIFGAPVPWPIPEWPIPEDGDCPF